MLEHPLQSVNLKELLDALHDECQERGIRYALVENDYETQVYREFLRRGFTHVTHLPELPAIDFVAQNQDEAYGVQALYFRGRIHFGVGSLVEACNLLLKYSNQSIRPMIVYEGRLGLQVEKDVRTFKVARFVMEYKKSWQVTAYDANLTIRSVLHTLVKQLTH